MALLQTVAAAALVLVSAFYAAWKLTSARLRARLLGQLVRASGAFGQWRWLTKLHTAALNDGAPGCGGCGAGGVRSRSAAPTRTPAAPPR